MDQETFGEASNLDSLTGLPAFFSGGSVDDKKYESLLADLRSHDLLGPDDGQREEAFALETNLEFLGGSLPSFMSDFDSSKNRSTSGMAPPGFASVPPGFSDASPGQAPTQADLDWARGQHEFEQLQEEYLQGKRKNLSTSADLSGYGLGFSGAKFGLGMSLGMGPSDSYEVSEEDDSLNFADLDATYLNNFRSLGIDVDDGSVRGDSSQGSRTVANKIERKTSSNVGSSTSTKPAPVPPPLPPKLPPPLPPSVGRPPPPPRAWARPNWPPPPRIPADEQNPAVHPPPGWQAGRPAHRPMFQPPPPRNPPPPPQRNPQQHQYNYPRPMLTMRSKMMTPRDIQFVLQQQMKQLRSSDPYSDDYYYHCLAQKRNRADSSGPRPPLPSWKLQHVRSIDPRDTKKANKSREWESVHNVLGRNDKASLYRPRELLSLTHGKDSDDSENEENDEDNGQDTKLKKVFSSNSWNRRRNIESGMQCLLSLQDARHILDARGINPQQFHQLDSPSIDPSLAQLRTRTASLLVKLAVVLGVSVSSTADSSLDDSNTLVSSNNVSFHCDERVLQQVLSVSKGKRMVCRALPLLHPSARFSIIPLLVGYMVGCNCFTKSYSPFAESDEDLDERMSQTLVVMLLYHPPLPSPIVLTQCIERAMSGHTIETLTNVLHNRPRAEVLQALLQKGGSECTNADSNISSKWIHWQNTFVQLATMIKEGST